MMISPFINMHYLVLNTLLVKLVKGIVHGSPKIDVLP